MFRSADVLSRTTLRPEGPSLIGRHASVNGGDTLRLPERLQILATEHWSLLATRSLSWSESFSRSAIFLNTLSGAVIALALAAQATSFGPGFMGFALVILPVAFFIGLVTFVRLVDVNREDIVWVQGMNRLRHAYLELAPDLEPYLVAGWHDDEAGVMTTLGAPGGHSWYHHVLVTTPAVIGTVDAVVGGTIAALASAQLGMASGPSIVIGVAACISLVAALAIYEHRAFRTRRGFTNSHFPTSDAPLHEHG